MMTEADVFPTPERIGNRRRFERLPGGGYAYVLVDDSVRVEMRYLRREHAVLHAEADVQCTGPARTITTGTCPAQT